MLKCFNIHDINNFKFDVQCDVVRIWDCGCDWATIQKAGFGQYDWSVLDKIIKFAIQHEIQIIMVLAMTPKWATAKENIYNAYGVDYIMTSPPDRLSYYYRIRPTLWARHRLF
jgi:hypothetical protein